MNPKPSVALVLLAGVLLACGGAPVASRPIPTPTKTNTAVPLPTAPPTVSPVPSVTVPPSPTASPTPSRCVPASPQQLAAIRAGVKGIQESNDVRDGYAVRSTDFQRAWFVAAKIFGPGAENGTDPGVWVMAGEQDNPAGIYSVNAFAREFSDWGDGSKTDAAFSMENDGAREAETCAR